MGQWRTVCGQARTGGECESSERKIEDENHKYISNVYGMGYQWIV